MATRRARPPQLRIGTSGWAYDHWRNGVFYPPEVRKGRELEYYCQVFDCVEVNSSFYHTPRESALTKWRDATPATFVFAYKASRSITHNRKLVNVEEMVDFVIGRARALGPKLGPILWQFSPRFAANLDRLAAFLALLPKDLRHGFEFRHPSWFCDDVYELLAGHGACLVWADTPEYPLAKVTTADFIYARLHGHEQLYASCYTRRELKSWARDFQRCLDNGFDVYVFFDNDAFGYAPRNALELRQIMRGL
ncbi:MAG: DUF72 domain-containing protein [Armatimonadetes bacterium]|nr:DUF72 domain-containing protein [Armatimonadota bacterium]